MKSESTLFAEANERIALMNALTEQVEKIRGLLWSSNLIRDQRYSHVKVRLEKVVRELLTAQDEIALTPSVRHIDRS